MGFPLTPSYQFLGLGAGFHKGYDVVCVMDFAAEYEDHLDSRTRPQAPEQHNQGYGFAHKAPLPQQQK